VSIFRRSAVVTCYGCGRVIAESAQVFWHNLAGEAHRVPLCASCEWSADCAEVSAMPDAGLVEWDRR